MCTSTSTQRHPSMHLSARPARPGPNLWAIHLSTYSPSPPAIPTLPTVRARSHPQGPVSSVSAVCPLIPTPTTGAGGPVAQGALVPFTVGSAHMRVWTSHEHAHMHQHAHARACAQSKTQCIREGPALNSVQLRARFERERWVQRAGIQFCLRRATSQAHKRFKTQSTQA